MFKFSQLCSEWNEKENFFYNQKISYYKETLSVVTKIKRIKGETFKIPLVNQIRDMKYPTLLEKKHQFSLLHPSNFTTKV